MRGTGLVGIYLDGVWNVWTDWHWDSVCGAFWAEFVSIWNGAGVTLGSWVQTIGLLNIAFGYGQI